ncbi:MULTISPECIES: DUF1120 domain-containing protein [Klebsiella]|uniref:DUF1120 domain-containing protein n=1 Tax=Klebsiella oxytoca TaxID=571 RepID=A0A6N2Y1R6_KLEOX|nr:MULTISPECIES: DUF1120 domain-containing protein [Klebsiella]OFN69208.1 hypothetical protein HMPREF2540_22780 [Enterobacter sp. HMSC055A11]EKU5183610.1 DUF1120 domain-containing protein [Klebsiella oxytoca]EKV6450132.1 DUF1120 domain-containing protein [Klebsiella oxytoca]MBK0163272.1 DUF1120 domain-containing protein [Klebsiella sp. S69]MEB7874048.1 DUF1120 domain-containing protein [Klebsiella oxytoca]
MRYAFVLFALLLSPILHAGDNLSIDFTVTAEAAACTPTLSHNGIVDFGERYVGSLSTSAFTQLGVRDITLTITCESSTGIAITARDARSSSAITGKDRHGHEGVLFQVNGGGYISDKSRLFGLGMTMENKPIGSYAMQIDSANTIAVDDKNVAVDIAGSASKEGPWEVSSLLPLPTGQDYFYTFVKKGSSVPQPITAATVPLQISASVGSNLRSGQKVTLDGEAVISIVYL